MNTEEFYKKFHKEGIFHIEGKDYIEYKNCIGIVIADYYDQERNMDGLIDVVLLSDGRLFEVKFIAEVVSYSQVTKEYVVKEYYEDDDLDYESAYAELEEIISDKIKKLNSGAFQKQQTCVL